MKLVLKRPLCHLLVTALLSFAGCFTASSLGQLASSAAAAEQAQGQSEAAKPNTKNGEAIALRGEGCGTAGQCFSCSICHGPQGSGKPDLGAPRLWGQPYAYLYSSLENFANGSRPSQTMHDVAAALSEEARRDVSAYYAATVPENRQPERANALGFHPEPEALSRGGVIAAVGDLGRGIQACQNCHGPKGSGLAPSYPALAGQYANYLENQLRAWKTGERKSDPLGIMTDIAKRLTDQEIRDVAEYYASIVPPETTSAAKAAGLLMPPPKESVPENGAAGGASIQ